MVVLIAKLINSTKPLIMKKLLLVIAICYVTINSNAQTNPVFGTYTTDIDYEFQPLDKTEITTGILYAEFSLLIISRSLM